MSDKLPVFRFHSDPIGTGIIVKRDIKCPVCEEEREYVYEGSFFSEEEVEDICPWCISNGKAAEKYSGEFQDSSNLESSVSENELDELVHRTPGYYGWQQELWLVHCGSPCDFIGYVGTKEIEEMKIDVEEDLEKEAKQYNITVERLKKDLFRKGHLSGYLFRCIKCGKYRLTTDCD